MILKRIPNSYSIWFIPGHIEFLLLEKQIIELYQYFDGIKIIPHVTLISNLDYKHKFLSKKVGKIAKKLSPFKIYFNGIGYSDEYFESLFFKVKTNIPLINARKLALLNFPNISYNYNPHLSLAYGKKDNSVKKNLKRKIQCPVKFFKVKDLYLAHNDEINLKWKIIDKFALKQ